MSPAREAGAWLFGAASRRRLGFPRNLGDDDAGEEITGRARTTLGAGLALPFARALAAVEGPSKKAPLR